MNELIFFLQLAFLVFFLSLSARFGEKGLGLCIAFQTIFANLFVMQQMRFFGFSVTCSDAFSVGSILGLNMLQERFGRESARSSIRLSFFSLLFFVVMAQLHLLYQPLPGDRMGDAFSMVLSSSWRTFLSSASVFYLVQRWDVLFYGWLQKKVGHKIRLFLSLFCSQVMDTVLFSFLGLYGMVENIVHVIGVSLFVKLVAATFCWGFSPVLRRGRAPV